MGEFCDVSPFVWMLPTKDVSSSGDELLRFRILSREAFRLVSAIDPFALLLKRQAYLLADLEEFAGAPCLADEDPIGWGAGNTSDKRFSPLKSVPM